MGTSVLHIKTEVECRVYLFDEEKGIAKPGIYFNLEVRKGEQVLLFVSTKDECVRCQMQYLVEEYNCDYQISLSRSQFVKETPLIGQNEFDLTLLSVASDEEIANGIEDNHGVIYSQDGTQLLKCMNKPNSFLYRYHVKEGCKVIRGSAFRECRISQISLPDGLTHIGNECFSLCTSLQDINLPEGLLYIGDKAFFACTNFLNILIPSSVKYFGSELFSCCSTICSIWLNSKNTYLGNDIVRNCFHLSTIVIPQGTRNYFEKLLPFEIHQKLKEGDAYIKKYYAQSHYISGNNFYFGKSQKQDKWLAVSEFRAAANLGNPYAQNNLASCYLRGDGVDQDLSAALKWFRKAVEQGYHQAQFNLGWCYENGRGVEQDRMEATKLYHKAAEQGHARAQYKLGTSYKHGLGVEQDYVEAVKWFCKAAEQGNAGAQYNLGLCYENGEGVELDWEEAAKWYRKGAEQGDADAQYYLKKLEDKKRGGKIEKMSKSPYYNFFDTETTGVPRDYKAPASNTRNWPRLVQLGWIVTDEEGNVLSQGNEIVKPEGFVIPADAARVHGITTERAQREGKPLREVRRS